MAAEPGGSLFNERDGGFSDHRRVLHDPQMRREGSRFILVMKMLLKGRLVLTVLVALRDLLLLLFAGQLVGRKHGACRTYLNNVEIMAAEPGGSLFNERNSGFLDHRRVLHDPQMRREGSRFLLVMKCHLGRQEFHLSAPRVDRLDTFRERRKVVPLSAGRQWCQWGGVLGRNSLEKIFVLLHSY
jgi:hypothetical protein